MSPSEERAFTATTPTQRLAAAIRQARLDQGLSQVAAATKGGCSPQSWKNAEKGQRPPRSFTLASIDRALRWETGVAASILAGDDPPPLSKPPPAAPDPGITAQLEQIRAEVAEMKRRLGALVALMAGGGDGDGA
ncbi:MAG: helix-turn-helix domain-containing protein [Acidimicrobiales bacterium]